MTEVRDFLERHLNSIFANDVDTYHATTVPELSLYEWYIVPQRVDGIPFHDFQMSEAARLGAAPMSGSALADSGGPRGDERPRTRFDLANYSEQRYGDTAIACYTMLVSTSTASGITVTSYNESRVMVKFAGDWKIVHVHKSPAYRAPLEPPADRATQSR